jgi:hypothetical protein
MSKSEEDFYKAIRTFEKVSLHLTEEDCAVRNPDKAAIVIRGSKRRTKLRNEARFSRKLEAAKRNRKMRNMARHMKEWKGPVPV